VAEGPEDLVTWIADLHARVARGDLDGRDRVDVGTGTLPAGLAAQVMLADLDHDDDLTPEQRRTPVNVKRRGALLSDLRRLREQIG
jgi:hypothetical protein